MTKKVMIVLVGLALTAACKSMVGIAPTHRDDVAAEAQILASDTRNLLGVARGQSVVPDSLFDALVHLHTAADNFTVETERGTSQDAIDSRYAELIRAWVRVKLIFPENKAEGALKRSYDEVVTEWENLSRAAGYAGKKYETKYGSK